MSVTYYSKPKYFKLNSDTSLKTIKGSDDSYYWFEMELVKDDGRTFSSPKSMNYGEDELVDYIYSKDLIIFYTFENWELSEDCLNIMLIVDLNTLEPININEIEKLKYFKEIYSEQIPPKEELEIREVEVPERRRVIYKIPREI